MISQLSIICMAITICQAGIIQYPQYPANSHSAIDYYAYPKYKFNYGVKDPYTGDNKSQYEERDGDKVRGSYQVHDPDGTIRTVTYTADDHNGFIAHVNKAGYQKHPSTYLTQKGGLSEYGHY